MAKPIFKNLTTVQGTDWLANFQKTDHCAGDKPERRNVLLLLIISGIGLGVVAVCRQGHKTFFFFVANKLDRLSLPNH
jgi:hypothetical protein